MSETEHTNDAVENLVQTTRNAGDLKQIRISPVKTLADFESCVEVQLAVWGYSDGDLIPKRVFIVAERIGGQVLGAYDGNKLVGFAMAFPGYRDGKPYLHSHMLAVLAKYRNAGLGRRLKLAQRDDALARGIDRMEWTFDPLEIKNAHLNIARLGAIAPERCQPFDRNRKGMVPGEGAAVLVLEKLDAALARGAKIYAEVLGYGVSCDSHHMTAAHPQGDGAIRAMQAAMRESDVTIDDIDYISAHGTGTPTNDRVEAMAVRTLFGTRASQVPMSSIKSMLGHTMGAASAIEAVACALALDSGWIPPTINHEAPDEDCTLDFVPNRARETSPRVILNNAYAFGGNNACLCLRRHQ